MCDYGTDGLVPVHGEDVEEVISVDLVAILYIPVKFIPEFFWDVFIGDMRAAIWRLFRPFFLVEQKRVFELLAPLGFEEVRVEERGNKCQGFLQVFHIGPFHVEFVHHVDTELGDWIG